MNRIFKPIECLDCGDVFTPTNSTQKRCVYCQHTYSIMKKRIAGKERRAKQKLLEQQLLEKLKKKKLMTINYGAYKQFLRDLCSFIKPDENMLDDVQEYIENNVEVNIPDKFYNAVKGYVNARDSLMDVLIEVTTPKGKKK